MQHGRELSGEAASVVMPVIGNETSERTLYDVTEEDGAVDKEEVRELQKKARALDNVRRSYMEESQRVIGRQQDAIARLKDENKKLKSDLDSGLKVEAANPSPAEQQRILQLKDLVESYSRKVEIEQRKVEEQKKDTEVTEAKALHLRKLIGGATGARDNSVQLQKMSQVLENRLEKAQVKYNQLLSKNKAAREEIDHLRKERVTFETIYKKLEDELQDKKVDMASKIEVSNIAYEARDSALAEMASVRAQSDGEQRAFEIEMARLGARLGAGRGRRDEALRNLLYSSVQSLSHAKGEKSFELDNYEAAFERLRSIPEGDAPPGTVVDNFIAAEDANMTLFNYTNELKQEAARLEEVLAEKTSELDQVKQQGTLEESGQRKGLLNDLQQEKERILTKLQAIQMKNVDMTHTFEVMADLAERLAVRVGADIAEMVGVGEGKSSVEALHMWLGVLEQRANEASTMWAAYKASRQTGGGPASTSPSVGAHTVRGKMQVVAPSIQDDGSGSDDDSGNEMPLTSSELKFRVEHESGIAYEKFLAEGQGTQTTPKRPSSAASKGKLMAAAGARARAASLQRSTSARSSSRAASTPSRPSSGASSRGKAPSTAAQDKSKKPVFR